MPFAPVPDEETLLSDELIVAVPLLAYASITAFKP